MKHQWFLFLLALAALASCQKQPSANPASYVDPFIGTGGHGHTFPGATVPFGMMQLSPDTRMNDWDGCSGYHTSDNVILGFSTTHLSGTGCSDYGDFRFTPTKCAAHFNIKTKMLARAIIRLPSTNPR